MGVEWEGVEVGAVGQKGAELTKDVDSVGAGLDGPRDKGLGVNGMGHVRKGKCTPIKAWSSCKGCTMCCGASCLHGLGSSAEEGAAGSMSAKPAPRHPRLPPSHGAFQCLCLSFERGVFPITAQVMLSLSLMCGSFHTLPHSNHHPPLPGGHL